MENLKYDIGINFILKGKWYQGMLQKILKLREYQPYYITENVGYLIPYFLFL